MYFPLRLYPSIPYIYKVMRFRLLILSLLLSLLTAYATEAGKVQRTTRRIPRETATKGSAHTTIHTDSCIVTSTADISLSGYEKPLRSRTESMFVTNHTSHRLTGLHLTITYHDLQARELHTRALKLSCDIPAGATRMITFPSWDRQQVFYYRLSSKPVRADGTPYDVHCACDSATVIL